MDFRKHIVENGMALGRYLSDTRSHCLSRQVCGYTRRHRFLLLIVGDSVSRHPTIDAYSNL